MINFCTLFDSNYLDKAMALLYSLQKKCSEFRLYVMCFDEIAYTVLKDSKIPELIVEKLSDFETPELLSVKEERSKAEYCWTCTPAVIEYFMNKYQLSSLTYIDADLYFFSDPSVLIEEIKKNDAHIGIIEHRFNVSNPNEHAGKYCVEFNYFDDSLEARTALSWWKERCLEWCFHKYEPETEEHCERYGDQKYLEQFEKLFSGVHNIKNLGGGVAPWNLKQYELSSEAKSDSILLKHKASGVVTPLVFYHYQNLKYISPYKVNINSQTRDKELKHAIYYPYLKKVTEMRYELAANHQVELNFRKSYSNNKIKAFIQRYIMPYKVKSLSDIIDLRKLTGER